MGFFKRLFPQKEKEKGKKVVEPMRGPGKLQTDEEQDAVRKKMEGEMSTARDKRDAAADKE